MSCRWYPERQGDGGYMAEMMAQLSRRVPSLEDLVPHNGCRAKPTISDRQDCFVQAAFEQQDREEHTRRFNEAIRRLRDADLIEFQPSDMGRTR
jgi:hypothetical protein